MVDEDAMMDVGGEGAVGSATTTTTGSGDITLGISLEPLDQVQQNLAQAKATTKSTKATATTGMELVRAPPPSASAMQMKMLAQRIIGNAFNFLASFGSDSIPLKAFEEWWRKFERKIEADPSFLERENT